MLNMVGIGISLIPKIIQNWLFDYLNIYNPWIFIFFMEYVPFGKSYDEFLELGATERDAHQADYMGRNRDWFEAKLAELNADYVVVNGRTGDVVISGALGDFPEYSWLEEFAEASGDIPINYVMKTPIEETVA